MDDENERLVETIPAFRVTQDVYDVVKKAKRKDRRGTIGEVARALLERGVLAYLRDGKLFDPDAAQLIGNATKVEEPVAAKPRPAKDKRSA